MRKFILLVLVLLTSFTSFSQDFSNKGKEFWLCFPNHIPSGPNGQMNIWITSDLASSGTVTLSNGTFTTNFNVAANGIVAINIPHALAHISNAESGMIIQKSIKVKVDAGQPAVVAYVQQFGNARSAATLLLPTNVLGKKYRAISFTHTATSGGGQNSRSHFQIIATQPNTQVEITPFSNGAPGTPFTIVFPNTGDMYQYQATSDVTGTLIESISSGPNGCLPIAVFSGNSAVTIGTNAPCNGTSYDPLFQQLYPVSTWGKNFGFIPFGDYTNTGNPYRIMASENNTTVTINGIGVAILNAGQIYPAAFTSNPVLINQPTSITADKPICVAQYMQTSGCSGSNNGDPDMVILNPIEQNIKDITVFTSTQQNINRQWINVLIPTAAAASFRINGAVPTTAFQTDPNLPGYSYLRHLFTPAFSGSRLLTADSGFNAILYGNQQSNFESYAYSAGTNVKDLTQALELETQYGIETSPSVCTNSPFKFKIYFPDSTIAIPPVAIRFDSLRWDLSTRPIIVPNNFPILQISPTIDSTNMRNGRQVNWYSLPGFYSFNTAGVDTLILTTYKSTNEGCGSELIYEFPIQISAPPVADFTWGNSGCVAEPVQFVETTPQSPKPTYRFWWNFGDPGSGAANTSTLRNPTHLFTAPGTYTVRYASTTTPGCLSDTVQHQITVLPLPTATISGTTSLCINSAQPDITFTGSLGTAPYTFTYTINGGAPLTVSSPGTTSTATVSVPTNVAGPFVYNLVSVNNTGSTLCIQNITGQSATVTVIADGTVTLTSAAGTDNQTVCINTPITNITYAVGGSGTGGSVSGLPTGVTGTYAAGVITITGSPSVSGTFNYTVTTTGPCITPTATGTITVTADATLALTSAAGTDNQTICINNAIVNITYAVGGTGTGGSVSGLPAGVTGIYAAGVITISGIPSVSGIFNYTVTTTGPCVKPTATGTITVTADATVTLTSAAGTDNQTVCINTPIINITYAVGGSGTGGSVIGLPPGVTGIFAGGVITISGSPTSTAGSPYNYTVITTGPCIIPTATGTISVNPDAAITLTSAPPTTSQELCNSSVLINITYAISGGGSGATVTGLPAGVTGVYAGGIFTISGSPTANGIFNYTVTTTGICVQHTATGTITVNALPTPNFTFTTPSCETRTIDFTDASTANSGALNSWSWNFGDPASGGANTSNLQNPSHTFATDGVYNVTLSVTTDKGCVSNPIATIAVTINDRPQAGFIIPEVCLSDTYAQFLDTSKIATGTITAWAWNFGDPGSGPLNTSTLQNPTHSYSAVGNYNVELIVTSALGCKDTIVQLLTVNGSFPIANFTVLNPTTLCANDSVAIVEASTVFPGVITKVEIYWDNVNFPAVFQIDNNPFTGKIYRHLYPNFQAPLTRIFTIRYRAYSGGVCVNDRLANITVNAAPLVQFNAMPDTCLLVAPFQITQASETGGVPGTGVFSGPGVSPTGIFSPAVAGIGTHRILYTFTSAVGGCVDTMSNTIRVLDTAHAAFTYIAPICQTVPGSFTDISTAPATVTLSNTVWDFGDGSPIENHAPGSTFGHLFPGPGTYTVTMYNVSAYGCNSTVTSQLVTVDPDHTISLSSAPGSDIQTVCINTLITQIQYTLGGGATNATVTGLPAGVTYSVTGTTLTILGSPTTTFGSPFTYTVLTSGNDCIIADTTGTITVEPDHTITLDPGSNTNQSVCVNTAIIPITYTLGGGATGVTITGLPTGVSYTVTGTTLTISGTPVVTVPFLFNYAITTAGNTCIKANAAGSIRVNPYPVPNFAVDKTSYCIPNAIVGFINGSTMPDGSGMTYSWNFGDGSPLSSGVNPSHWYTSQGPFNVRLTVTSTAMLTPSGIGCAHDTVIALNTIHPQPKADFSFNKPSVCAGDNVTLTDLSDGKDGSINQWNWDMGDGSIRTTNTVTYTYSDTITYNVKLYTVNTHGCNSDTVTKTFTVYPYPHVNAGPDRSILEGGQITLTPVVYGNDLQFLWTPNLYLIDNRIEKVKINKPLTDMTYRLTVTARGGCSRSDDVFVKLLKFPIIPNTFTPNNDGINDAWRIDYLNTYPNNRVQVFTRTGQLVFESRGYNTPWDGTIKGKPLPFDTYYYIIEPGNGRDPLTGYVTILK